jgi:nucleoid-associated protein YgaU
MRKDVKIGMLIGTGLCLVAAVWFCMHQQVVEQPRVEDLLSQKKENFNKENFAAEKVPQIKLGGTEEALPAAKNPGTAQISPAAPPAVSEKSVRMHIVLPGQTLTDISRIYYGSNGGWKKIYEANKDSLARGPDTIKAGMKLIIPE